ncbi:RcnB family protein [Sphingomonas sanguinis]|uniref:RcnB family protein n=1 Tax=Sphingomonas sp. LC-1 TaxID=3110957 RepID=UPI0021BB4F44|nr:RcnB family protein [Sphingomonas sp. LC-1]MCT8002681.1 RcnB family protein [Sphingomonas sp. LC-1]
MNRHWMAALLAATAMVSGAMPAIARAQQMIDQGPRARPEGGPGRGGPGRGGPDGPGGRGGPGGPAGRLERSEGRPIFNDRAAFPENRPAFRPDHAEAPRPQQPPPPPAPRDRGEWGPRGDIDRGPRPGPAPDQIRPDRGGPGGVRVDRGWRNDRGPGWRDPAWRDPGQDQRWRDEARRQREDRNRWGRNYNDWRDHSDQSYGFAERRAWANQWNRSWRRDRRYDWLEWRSLNRGAYHLPRYYAPFGGYGYQRFSSGVIIDPEFFGQSYWLDDPYSYRLPPAYGSYRWVRYYNDAILVDLRSGLVVDVVYDIFW